MRGKLKRGIYIMIRFKKTKLIASIAMALCLFSQPVISFSKDITDKNQSIDSGISSLSYNRNEVLASNGDKIESFVPKEGKKTGNKFIVVERQKKIPYNITSRYINN